MGTQNQALKINGCVWKRRSLFALFTLGHILHVCTQVCGHWIISSWLNLGAPLPVQPKQLIWILGRPNLNPAGCGTGCPVWDLALWSQNSLNCESSAGLALTYNPGLSLLEERYLQKSRVISKSFFPLACPAFWFYGHSCIDHESVTNINMGFSLQMFHMFQNLGISVLIASCHREYSMGNAVFSHFL